MRLGMNLAFAELLALLVSQNLCAQGVETSEANETSRHFLSLQWIGFTYHPDGGDFPELYPWKIDEQGYGVFEIGLGTKYDYQFRGRYFIRASIAYYKDCAFVDAGYLHLGLRAGILNKGRHSINAGLGPTLLLREDWHKFDEYAGDEFYGDRVTGEWQYRFILYAAELEYLCRFNDRYEFQYSLVPGYPAVLTSFVGMRFKL